MNKGDKNTEQEEIVPFSSGNNNDINTDDILPKGASVEQLSVINSEYYLTATIK
jgi:hypothetical protein